MRTKRVVRTVLFAALCGVFLSGSAPAQIPGLEIESFSQKPPATAPINIAMIYYKYSAQAPDFSVWAALSDEYKNAPDFDKQNILRMKADALAQNFGLLVPNEQIIIDQPVELSEYSFESKGYLLENVRDDMFFTVSYGGENFALVPKNILDFQWLAAEEPQAKALDDLRAQGAGGREVSMTFVLKTLHASKAPLDIDGKPYRVLAVEVQGLSAFDGKGALAWTYAPPGGEAGDAGMKTQQKRNDLLQLYQ
jgi:hypothetical protein